MPCSHQPPFCFYLLTQTVPAAPRDADELREQLAAFSNFTILVLLEGVDPNASCTLQCRKVYSLQDFVFSHDFAPCTRAENDGEIGVGLACF